jgi:hypothetical protein
VVEHLISDRDEYSAEEFPTTEANLRSAAFAQAQLERDWRLFLISHAKFNTPKRIYKQTVAQAIYLLMKTKRMSKASRGGKSSATMAYRRLLNIDLSHKRILEQGIKLGARSILILEDDASPLPNSRVSDLKMIIESAQQNHVDFVNLSESISARNLGVKQILSRSLRQMHLESGDVVAVDVPITNTVCANLYSSKFADLYLGYLSNDHLIPVKPIDWRLNEVMMDNPKTSCWWVVPGLFVQRSMLS